MSYLYDVSVQKLNVYLVAKPALLGEISILVLLLQEKCGSLFLNSQSQSSKFIVPSEVLFFLFLF